MGEKRGAWGAGIVGVSRGGGRPRKPRAAGGALGAPGEGRQGLWQPEKGGAMSGQAYAGTAGRGFRQAVIQLLESQYGGLGSQRVVDLRAEDLERLVEQFYPARQRVSSGWMVFTGTRASGGKAHPGRRVGEHELVTLAWPVLLAEDVQELAQGVPDGAENQPARRGWLERRLTRIVEYGLSDPPRPGVVRLGRLGGLVRRGQG